MAAPQSSTSPRPGDPNAEVIVAFDGSPGSQTALRWAAATGLRLRVARSWEHPASLPLPWSRISPKTSEEVDETVRTETEQAVAEVLPTAAVEVETMRGPAGTALVTLAATRKPAMLVVGSRGHGGFAGLLLGSVSRQCLENAPCPVVVVPGPERALVEPVVSSIVVGVDRSPLGQQALRVAMDLAARCGASVTAVHAFEPPAARTPSDLVHERRSQLDQDLRAQFDSMADENVTSEYVISDGDPREVLVEVASQRKADLLVVGALGEGTIEKHIGPVANYLAAHVSMPLAVVR